MPRGLHDRSLFYFALTLVVFATPCAVGQDEVALQELESRLGSDDPWVRAAAARELARRPGRAGLVVSLAPALVRGLGDSHAALREESLNALAQGGRAAGEVVSDRSTVVSLFSDEVPDVRVAAFRCSGVLWPPSRHVAEALLRALRQEGELAWVLVDVIAALGRQGDCALVAQTDLFEIVAHERGRPRLLREAIETVGEICPEDSVGLLEAILRDPSLGAETHVEALRSLIKARDAAQAAANVIVPFVGHQNAELRATAVRALGYRRPSANTVEVVLGVLDDDVASVCVASTIALGMAEPGYLGPNQLDRVRSARAKVASPLLREALRKILEKHERD